MQNQNTENFCCSKDIEIIWRTARALYNLSLTPDISNDVRKEMIGEAQNILESSYTIGKSVLLKKT